jgi:hypothetical protein
VSALDSSVCGLHANGCLARSDATDSIMESARNAPHPVLPRAPCTIPVQYLGVSTCRTELGQSDEIWYNTPCAVQVYQRSFLETMCGGEPSCVYQRSYVSFVFPSNNEILEIWASGMLVQMLVEACGEAVYDGWHVHIVVGLLKWLLEVLTKVKSL